MSKKYDDVEIDITDIEFPDTGTGVFNDKKVSVKNTLPGQTVIADLRKRRKQYAGRLKGIVRRADYEITPDCPVFGECGGCSFRNLSYEKEIELKEMLVKKLLDRAGIRDYTFMPIKRSPAVNGYRNKMEFSFGDNGIDGELCLGMRKKHSYYEVAEANNCRIAHDDFCRILECVTDYFRKTDETFYHKFRHSGSLRHLLIRRGYFTKEILIGLVTTSELRDIPEELVNRLLELPLEGRITGICHIQNDSVADVIKADEMKTVYGRDFFYEKLLGLDFRISVFSFFQTNSPGAEVLYNVVREFAGSEDDKVIFDLYCGTGTITQLLSKNAKKVIGVELVSEAADAAKQNAELNNITNCEFIAGDVLDVIDELEDKPDIIVLDPPREGIHPKAINKIISFGSEEIIYVSCKPNSLARDLLIFAENGYKAEKIQCVDMFPRTSHIETVCLLRNCKNR